MVEIVLLNKKDDKKFVGRTGIKFLTTYHTHTRITRSDIYCITIYQRCYNIREFIMNSSFLCGMVRWWSPERDTGSLLPPPPPKKNHNIYTRDLNKVDYENFFLGLLAIDMVEISNNPNANDAFNNPIASTSNWWLNSAKKNNKQGI